MRILEPTLQNILAAAQRVKAGGVVVFPTDTVYGLGCNPFDVNAVKKVLRLKEKRGKPLPLLASNIGHVERVAIISSPARKIATSFWPGPVTLVVPKKPIVPSVVTGNLNSVGVRVPDHTVALKLIESCGGLLVGTSANRTGLAPSQTAQEAAQQLRERVDIIIDGEKSTGRVASTVVDLTSKIRIIRRGAISIKEISEALRGNATQSRAISE